MNTHLQNIQEKLFNKILSGKATIENPYTKPLLELWEVIAYLKTNKQKVPKLLEDLAEEFHKKNLSYNPFK